MPKTFNGAIKFPSNFDVQATRPLDNRLVVNSYDDLTNGSIAYPYQGMVVNIKGTSELWILKTQGVEASHHLENWELVTGSGSGEEVRKDIEDVKEGLGTLTELVGNPGTESDEPTGIFEELDTLKKNVKGASLSNYILPVMTQDMVDAATEDSDVDFDGSEDPHILIEDPYESAETHGDMYLNLIQNMASVINTLQPEIYRLKNIYN